MFGSGNLWLQKFGNVQQVLLRLKLLMLVAALFGPGVCLLSLPVEKFQTWHSCVDPVKLPAEHSCALLDYQDTLTWNPGLNAGLCLPPCRA